MATAKVDYNSDLIRRKWMREGMIQEASKSFWAAYKGHGKNSIIYQQVLSTAGAGHTVVFDFDGNLVGKGVRGNQTAEGTGETKRKFSDKLTVADYRFVVDNGTAFDGVEIGNLALTQHQDSRQKLADVWVRIQDQCYFDLGQQSTNTYNIDLGTTFDLDAILEMEKILKLGSGFTHFSHQPVTGTPTRRPLEPFRTSDGQPIWLVVIDTPMKMAFLKSTGAQNLLKDIDVRGNDNRIFKSAIGKIGSFVFVEAPNFFGANAEGKGPVIDSDNYFNFVGTEIEISGMRRYDMDNQVWTGDKNFDPSANLKSRGLILGNWAFQLGMGKEPDYKFASHDFGKFSESAFEVWCGAKPALLKAENEEYEMAKVAGYNYGFVTFDVQTQTANP